MIDASEFRKKAPVDRDWILYSELLKIRAELPDGAYTKREKTVNWASFVMSFGAGVGTIIVGWLKSHS
jgi:hypothetical protein